MVLRKFRGAVAAAILATSLAGEGGAAAAAAAAPAPSFSLSGILVAANANTHRISVRVGAMRHSIVLTPRTRYLVQRHEATLFALRSRMRVTVRGLVQARWREAVVVTVGPGPVPGAVPAPANTALKGALGSALEREQYALASYQNVVSQLGPIGPFPNVIQGEQQHVATLKAFFAEYGISLPTTVVSGASAPATTTGACALGVSIEQSLISLYD
ncbi:MAG: hypothetical protein M0004_08155, partial [Actinomycetota bacterium]|nr:hypothetical protein [Actinomycetota bacterium]